MNDREFHFTRNNPRKNDDHELPNRSILHQSFQHWELEDKNPESSSVV